jgi:hypothetical protein
VHVESSANELISFNLRLIFLIVNLKFRTSARKRSMTHASDVLALGVCTD